VQARREDMLRGVLLKLAATPQHCQEDSPQKQLQSPPQSPCASLRSQSRQRERNPWLIKASKAAAKLEPRCPESPVVAASRKTWYIKPSSGSARIASAPSSPVGNIGPLTRKTWFVAPQRVNLLLTPVPAIAAPPREPPVPAAALAPRKKWYMSAPSPTHKVAANRTEQQQQQPPAAAAAAAPSARKKWYRPPLSRSASSSTRLQLKAAPQPAAAELPQPQPLQPLFEQQQQQEQESAAISDDSSHKGSSRLWRRRSMSSVPSQQQQQQQQLEQRPPAHTFEIEEGADASVTSDNDDDDDDDGYPTPVPEALLYRDAQWPAGSKVRQRFSTQHYYCCITYNYCAGSTMLVVADTHTNCRSVTVAAATIAIHRRCSRRYWRTARSATAQRTTCSLPV
jgi:hypothetical protein